MPYRRAMPIDRDESHVETDVGPTEAGRKTQA